MYPPVAVAAPEAAAPETASTPSAHATEGTAVMPQPEPVAAAIPEASTAPADELSAEELLRIENTRLRTELAAFADERARARDLVKAIDDADTMYEASKDEAKKHKKERDEHKATLRALVAGDVNVKIDFTKPADDGGAEPAKDDAPKPALSERLAMRPVQSTYGVAQFKLTRDDFEKADCSAVRPMVPELDKRKVDAIGAGPLLFLALEQECFGDGSGAFVCWPLIDADSWDVNYATKFAPAMGDMIDESPDVAARRRAGGERCGYKVKVTGQRRKRFVIGPDAEAVRFLHGTGGDVVEATCEAARYLPATLPAAKTAEVIAFPTAKLGDALEARLREYQKTTRGFHEGALGQLAADLKVSDAEIAAAARADSFRFDLFADDLGGTSHEIVRLLTDEVPQPTAAREPEVLGGENEAVGDSQT